MYGLGLVARLSELLAELPTFIDSCDDLNKFKSSGLVWNRSLLLGMAKVLEEVCEAVAF